MPAQYKNSWDRAIDLLPEAVCAVERIVSDAAAQPKQDTAGSADPEE